MSAPLREKTELGEKESTIGPSVSWVRTGQVTATKLAAAADIIGWIRAGKSKGSVENIRRKFSSTMVNTGGDRKTAKEIVREDKLQLPGVLWSGTFHKRRADKLVQHSGLLCADLDGLAEESKEVRANLLTSIHLWAIFSSPTGDGLKCVFRVPADAATHKASFLAVEEHVRNLTRVKIDESCSDVSRLCFLSYDPEVYLNLDAVELPPLIKVVTASPPVIEVAAPTPAVALNSIEPRLEERRNIAIKLLGEIQWSATDRGFCVCPAEHLHTSGDGARDCEVYLAGAPAIHCFHDHCRGIVKAVNRDLRSRIGAVEWGGAAASEDLPVEYPRNDTERALRFVRQFGDDLRYVAAWKQWVVWDGTRWAPDLDGAVFRKAQELPKLLLREAGAIDDLERRKKAASAAIAAGDERKLKAMLSVAEYQSGIAASPALFDSNTFLVGVTNGVVDLRTGQFRPAAKEDYITKQLNVAFDQNSKCPVWEKFLRRVLNDDPELISFMQRAVGYSLTGEVSEHCLFFLYGMGQNGKSTFAECLYALFGEYALKATTSLYTLDKHGKEPEGEIARLVGRRFVTGSETEEGAKLAESRVKDITGGDTLTGRNLYCPAFNFKPTHNLWVYGNHRPDVRGNDHGMWRRIRLIPFLVQISDSEKDPQLPSKLLDERSGILNWGIEGCLDWQQVRLPTPRAVADATAEYREEEDEVGEFISALCFEVGRVERTELYQAYKEWNLFRGMRYTMTPKAFTKRLRARDGVGESKSGGRYWTGISLRIDADERAADRHPDLVRLDLCQVGRVAA